MGRPKTPTEQKMSRVLTAKLTPLQEEAWDKLRAAVGGGGLILPRDSDVLRFAIAETCKRFGVVWPGAPTSTSSQASPPAPEPPTTKAPVKRAKRRP